jgi:hypothetical protein
MALVNIIWLIVRASVADYVRKDRKGSVTCLASMVYNFSAGGVKDKQSFLDI